MATRIPRRRCPRLPVALALVSLLAPSLAVATAQAGLPRCRGETATHIGTRGDDVMRGTARADVFVGFGGDDRLIGRGGNDVFCAGGGNDLVKGGGGDDVLAGQGGADTLLGGGGNDTILGAGGDDALNGGRGDDALNGGPGTDDCVAGEEVTNYETPAPRSGLDGRWAGMTSHDEPITFTVTDNGIDVIAISFTWKGPGCVHEDTVEIDYDEPLEIVGDEFDIVLAIFTFQMAIHGEFISDTEATGSFAAFDPGVACPGAVKGTWDAVRN